MRGRTLFAFLLILKSSKALTTAEEADYDGNSMKNCICVPFWQCKEDYSGIIEDGLNLIDMRAVKDDGTTNLPPCTGEYDVCCKIGCGRRNSRGISQRILGENNEAEFGEFPWMLGILENESYKCGASLIHPQVALTAAHCVSRQFSAVYKVRAGEWNWESFDEEMRHQDRLVKKIITHPLYHPQSLANDIALLLLDQAFHLTEHIGTICLPPPKTTYDSPNCIASGWGRNSHAQGNHGKTLKKIELPLRGSSECAQSLREAKMGPHFYLHRSFICAGGEANRDTCKGDGGSPLVCPVPGKPGQYEQAGIVSWGLSCGLANTPGVYVNVAVFSEWIDNEMIRNDFDSSFYKM